MSTIEVIYENGVFRPLSRVELPEGARAEVIIGQADLLPVQENQPAHTDAAQPTVGEELVALLDQIAGLPYTPDPDGQTDVSTRHDDFLYPKHGKIA